MDRILSRRLLRSFPLVRSKFSTHAYRSFSSSSGRLIEIDLDSSSSSSASSSSSRSSLADAEGAEYEALALKKLDDLIHRIMIQKATPDWLPFVPGSSFWVPPRPGTSKVMDVVSRLAEQLNPEESLSLTTSRGWPCSSFLLTGNESANPTKVEVEAKSLKNSEDTAQSEDEEG